MSEEATEVAEVMIIDKRSSAPEQQALECVAKDNTPGALLRMALERNLDLDRIEKLMELQERWEANEARKAYVAAMSEFKKDPPLIVKDKKVSFRTSEGQLVEYEHESLGMVVAASTEKMAKVGLHHEWKVLDQGQQGLKVACRITHVLGHFEDTVLSGPTMKSRGMNQLQSIKSTITYLKRITLMMGLGLATTDDDDGRRALPEEPEGTEEPPQHQDPQPNKRALDAIGAYAKYLGKDNARTDLERFLGQVAGRWEADDYARLKEVWDETVKPIKDATPDEKKEALLRVLRDEPDFGEPEGNDAPPNDGDQQDLL